MEYKVVVLPDQVGQVTKFIQTWADNFFLSIS